MSKILNTLNDFMVDLFYKIVDLEEKVCSQGEFSDLSITEIHTIEAIGIDSLKKMSEIAVSLDITVGTLTTAINKLVKKNYVQRIKIIEDRRVVQIELTDKGRQAYAIHQKFHYDIIETMAMGLNEEEEDVLVVALNNVSNYLKLNKSLKVNN